MLLALEKLNGLKKSSKSVLKKALFGQNGPQNGHYGAGKGRRSAVFALMLPLYHPGGMGAGLGPIR